MRSIWFVIGSTGEYSDHSSWSVAAYTEEDTAKQHAELANLYVKDTKSLDWEERSDLSKHNPYDKDCRIDYTGAEYTVQEIPLCLHVDDYQERITKVV